MHVKQEASSLRRRAQDNGNPYGRELTQPCVVLLSDTLYEDQHEEEQPMECELQGDDLNGKAYQMVSIKNLPLGFAKNHHVESARSTFFVYGARIDDEKNELFVPEIEHAQGAIQVSVTMV